MDFGDQLETESLDEQLKSNLESLNVLYIVNDLSELGSTL